MVMILQEGDGTCNALRRVFDFKRGMGQEEANQYKYIFDMGEQDPAVWRCFY
jgi:hypothetical protein